MRKTLTALTFLISAQALAGRPQPYTEKDVADIQKTVINSVLADPEELNKVTGPFTASVLWSTVIHDGGSPVFTGHGQTLVEAEVKASMQCIHWRCEHMSAGTETILEDWRNSPPEKLISYMRALGALDRFPQDLVDQPDKFKEYVLTHVNFDKISCLDPRLDRSRMAIYVYCFSSGYQIESQK